MYNLDKNTRRTDLGTQFLEALRAGGYLQSIPQDPGEHGPGSAKNYQVTSSPNGLRCVVHGGVQ